MKKASQIFIFITLAALLAIAGIRLAGEKQSQTTGGDQNSGGYFGAYSKMALIAFREPDEKLLIPVKGIAKKQIANTWGADRSGGRRHSGQDIFAKRGTPVFSATEGYVLRVGENDLGGKVVFIYGAGGRRYYYAHLDDFAPGLKTGDFVTPDTLLGFVGTTGNARNTPPHLHFGVYAGGGAIDPLPLLTDRASAKTEEKL